MKKYDIRIRRGSFQEKRIAGYKDYELVSRRYKKTRMRGLWLKLFYILFLVGVSVLLIILFR